ncbi:FAD-binding oxidoreductase [Roseicyclus sp. F158]|uniref:FAD-binding oxidoreductase n=1 Tax=Tropicimonas omnivorans TaxID=3075590 RepID=A0ABU3DFA5_9RHOB|nr:FAD-binding oxidoreductase [Roseicyclus sp. F158]MDT0682390.1 FAD-binding oxidoreductase [Roseicyclus sp. F158]
MAGPVTTEAEAELRAALPGSAFRDLEPRYLEEGRGLWHGTGGLLIAPRTAEELSAAMRIAARHRISVIPYGGGTGTVGGQIGHGLDRPLIVSLERMTRIRAVHPEANVLIAEGGAILADVHRAADAAGRLFPLSLGSEGSARIGGLLGTNAGGTNVLRYGNARELTLGVEAVMADGSILRGLKRLRKDNSGYDLRGLLVGSEGTLGIITAAALRLFPIPAETGAAMLVVRSPKAALALLGLARERLGEQVSGFELMERTGLRFLKEALPNLRAPFEELPEWSVLVDIGLAEGQDAKEALSGLYEAAVAEDLVTDGVIAGSEAQRQAFWDYREAMPLANRHVGAICSQDISVPLERLPDFIEAGRAAVAEIGPFRINCFGHVGDGNLHFNVFAPEGESRDAYRANGTDRRLIAAIHDVVHEMEGSISAEHGVGRLKVGDLERYQDPVKLAAMRAIKRALDPSGILNPGAVLRAD